MRRPSLQSPSAALGMTAGSRRKNGWNDLTRNWAFKHGFVHACRHLPQNRVRGWLTRRGPQPPRSAYPTRDAKFPGGPTFILKRDPYPATLYKYVE
jgi:hypothetical protein